MSRDFSFAIPISSENAIRWEINKEALQKAFTHDEINQVLSEKSKQIMIKDIQNNVCQKFPDKRFYLEHSFLSVDDPNMKDASYKFVRIDCIRHVLLHLPKTAGRYFYSNYLICKHPSGREHVHQTFNPGHSLFSGLEVFDLARDLKKDNSHSLEIFHSLVTIVRNPFDWLASFYHTNGSKGWRNLRECTGRDFTFERFIMSICENDDLGKALDQKIYPFSQGLTSPLFDPSGTLQVGNVLFFERILQGANSLNMVNRDPDKVSSSMQTFRQPLGRGDYRDLYTDTMTELVYDKFRFDFEWTGYGFDGLDHDKDNLTFKAPTHRDKLV